jgi:hypothetical protein
VTRFPLAFEAFPCPATQNLHHALAMKIRQKWLALLIVGAAIIPIFLIFRQGREPTYEGRPLSYWIDAIDAGDRNESDKAEQAIKQIGTNGVSFALEWIAYKPPAWKTYLWRVHFKTQNSTARWIPVWATGEKEIQRRRNAMMVFYWLGPSAEHSIPRLTEIARNPDRYLRERACQALLVIGWQSFPAYVQLLADTNAPPDLRFRATRNLNELLFRKGDDRPFDSTTLLAVSPLIRNLGDADPTVAAEAATALGLLGLQPELSLPALTEASKDPRPQVRESVVRAIKIFAVSSSTNRPPEWPTIPVPFVHPPRQVRP